MTHSNAQSVPVAPVGAWDRLAIVSLGAAGSALSYDALQQMAVAIHIRGLLTYLFPLVIDGFIAYGVRALLVLSRAPWPARLYVWTLFGTATAASIWANALHAVRLNEQTQTNGLRLGDTVVAILSTLAPLALAGAVHLYILITRHRPTDHRSAVAGADQERAKDRADQTASTSTADQDRPANFSVDHADQQAEGRRADQPTNPGADHGTNGTGGRTSGTVRTSTTFRMDQTGNDGPSHSQCPDQQDRDTGDHAPDRADQRTTARAVTAGDNQRTSISAGHPHDGPHPSAAHEDVDQGNGPACEPDADHQRPADQEQSADPNESADQHADQTDHQDAASHADQRTNASSDREDHAPDHLADDGATGPDDAGVPDQDADQALRQTKGADQNSAPGDDEVPMSKLVEIAREAALEEGRLTRRAIRPHLRAQSLRISNERFKELQTHLYEDPALAHLPRPSRRTR